MADKSTIIVYHNARCSKSRCALEMLREKGKSYEVIEYMKNPLSVEEIKVLVEQLGIRPEELIRKGEKVYKEKFASVQMTPEKWYKAMSEHPELIERPIILRNGKAVVARPADRMDEVI